MDLNICASIEAYLCLSRDGAEALALFAEIVGDLVEGEQP